MGQIVSRRLSTAAGNVVEIISRGQKRKRDFDDSSSCDEDFLEESLTTPKRKRLLTTTQYIYQTLFKEEQSSDIDVYALGKIWHMHKVYLCQSPYFASMFNGRWREATERFIKIEISDPRITIDSLYVVFGSLYQDEVTLEPIQIISILATATLFHLTGLIEKCVEVMKETTNAETVVSYYDAACDYGVQSVKEAAMKWLQVNLMNFFSKHSKYLRTIDADLMATLVTSRDLHVIQTEFSVYILLRNWLLLRIKSDWKIEDNARLAETFFAKRTDKTPFVETSHGEEFEPVFRSLRMHNLILNSIDIKTIRADNIIPIEWLYEPLTTAWVHMLQVDQSVDEGPKAIEESVFYKNCIRCGRVLGKIDTQKWRWTGFTFGLDLVLAKNDQTLSIRRHHRSENERLLSLQTKRQFLIKLTLTSLNEFRQIKHSQSTEILSIALEKNEEKHLMQMDTELTLPMLVSVNLLVVTPTSPKTPATSSVSQDATTPHKSSFVKHTPIA